MIRLVRVVQLMKSLLIRGNYDLPAIKVAEWHLCCMCSCSSANYTIPLEIYVSQNLTNEQFKP